MPSQRTQTTQPRKHARKAVPTRFDIRNSAVGIRPVHQNCDNGFIWLTTGSGKTRTSFNLSNLATLRDTLIPKLLSGELAIEVNE